MQWKTRTNRSVNVLGAETATRSVTSQQGGILTFTFLEYALNAVNQGVTALGIKGRVLSLFPKVDS